jgi:hypothetical protein
LTPVQSLDILIQAARLAQGKGAFTLEEAALVHEAIEVFKATAPTQQPAAAPANADATPAAETEAN